MKDNNQYSDLETGISIIREIKSKIGSLNSISTKDFLFLNSLHKKYYSSIQQIIGFVTNIDEVLNNKNEIESINESIELTESVKELIKSKIKNFEKSINTLNEISLNGTYLDITTYSYKQSIVTFKLLSTNNLLNIVFDSELQNTDLVQYWQDFDKSINIIEAKCFHVKKDIKHFIKIAENTKHEFERNVVLLRHFLKFIDSLNEKLKLQFNSINEYKKSANLIKAKLEANLKAVDSTVINLQYHDIIRQKMEHIQALLDDIDKELHLHKQESLKGNNSEMTNKYLYSISEIAKIQIKQLFNINSEFQSATMNIVQNFFETSDDINSIQKLFIGKELKSNNRTIKTSLLQLEKSINDIENEEYADEVILEKLDYLKDFFSEIVDKCNDLSTYSKKLNSTAVEIGDLLKKENFQKEETEETAQIIESELNRAQINFNKISKTQNQISNNCLILVSNYTSDEVSQYNNIDLLMDFNETKLEVEKVYKKLKSVANYFSKLNKISLPFMTNVGFKIEKISYYNYYDSSILTIIDNLNKIVGIIQKNVITGEKDKKQILDELKRKYTVSSEHKIHDETTGDESSSDKEEDESGLELF